MGKNQNGCGCGQNSGQKPVTFGFRPVTKAQLDLADRIRAVHRRKNKTTGSQKLL